MTTIAEKLKQIRDQISRSASKAGRDPAEILLVAVTKGQPTEKIREACNAGQNDFGENYAQEMLDHQRGITGQVRWHFIGHLQRNKVRQVLEEVELIHSVDSLDLAQEIDQRGAKIGKKQSVLIEVNLGGEETKSGIGEKEARKLAEALNPFEHLALEGLMVIPPPEIDPEKGRPYFRGLREIRDEMNKKNLYKAPLKELSMGMSHDFRVAIEEGATIVRIGTGIFGERK